MTTRTEDLEQLKATINDLAERWGSGIVIDTLLEATEGMDDTLRKCPSCEAGYMELEFDEVGELPNTKQEFVGYHCPECGHREQ